MLLAADSPAAGSGGTLVVQAAAALGSWCWFEQLSRLHSALLRSWVSVTLLLCHTPLQVCVHRCGLHSQPGTLSFTFYPAMPGNSTTLPGEKWDNQRPVMAASMGQALADRAFEGASRWVLVLVCVICCAGLCWVVTAAGKALCAAECCRKRAQQLAVGSNQRRQFHVGRSCAAAGLQGGMLRGHSCRLCVSRGHAKDRPAEGEALRVVPGSSLLHSPAQRFQQTSQADSANEMMYEAMLAVKRRCPP